MDISSAAQGDAFPELIIKNRAQVFVNKLEKVAVDAGDVKTSVVEKKLV